MVKCIKININLSKYMFLVSKMLNVPVYGRIFSLRGYIRYTMLHGGQAMCKPFRPNPASNKEKKKLVKCFF